MLVSLLGTWAIAHAAGCSSLSPIDLGFCGNNVVEPDNGEECDGHDQGENTHCNSKDHAYRCRFDCLPVARGGKGHKCPEGYRCGGDGVCRRPSGRFALSNHLDVAPGAWVGAIDVDGNGTQDVVSRYTQHFAVHFVGLGDEGTGQHTFLTPITSSDRGHPAIGDLDGDGYGDVVLPEEEGLNVLRGSPFRALEPSTYLTYALPGDAQAFAAIDLVPNVVVGLNSTYYGDEAIVLSGKYLLSMTEPPVTKKMHKVEQPTTPVTLPESASKLIAEPIVAQLDESTSTAELLLAYRDVLLVFVPKVRVVGETLIVELEQRPEVKMPGSVKINKRGVFPFVNTDGHIDLLLSTDKGLYLVDGGGDGNFDEPFVPPKLGDDCKIPTDPLLAAAELDGDLFPDFVFAGGIVLSTHESFCVEPQFSLPKPGNGDWNNAVIADFNDDGRADLVAASDSTGGVDFYNGTDSGKLNHSKLATTNKVDHLTVGDFDGDNLLDLAMVELEVDGQRDMLSIAYGVPAGPLKMVTPIGSLYEISDVSATNMAQLEEKFVDGISDLAVVAQYPPDSGISEGGFALLYGRSDRQLQSPSPVSYEVGNGGNLRYSPFIVAFVRGNFTLLNGATDRGIVSVGSRINKVSPAPFAALSMTAASSDATLTTLGNPADTELSSENAGKLVGLMAALDVDGDGEDEQAFLIGSKTNQGLELRLGRFDAEKGSVLTPSVVVDDASLVGFPLGPNQTPVEQSAEWAHSLHNNLQPCQLEEEAAGPALLVAVVEHGPEGNPLGTALQVYRHAALAGLLGATQDGAVAFERIQAPAGEVLLGFSCVDADGQGNEELALLTLSNEQEYPRARIYLLSAEEQGFAPWGEPVLELDEVQLPGLVENNNLPPLFGLTKGDTNGDGIDDIILSARDDILLVQDLPVVP